MKILIGYKYPEARGNATSKTDPASVKASKDSAILLCE
jgi:hypothetical protein